jgi:hypothetical protein
MYTQDIIKKLWNEAGNGNIAVWKDGFMTVVPPDYSGDTDGKKPLLVLKPLLLVLKYDFLDFAACQIKFCRDCAQRITARGKETMETHLKTRHLRARVKDSFDRARV